MVMIRSKRDWELPERLATPEAVYWNRRTFLKALGYGALGAAGLLPMEIGAQDERMVKELEALPRLAAKRNEAFKVERPLTAELVAGRYNNFYEFSRYKDDVWEHARDFKPLPWRIEVGGMVQKQKTYDVDDLIKRMPLEERVYRFRCVEAWSMVVPWIGFPMKALLDDVQPLGSAKFVKLTTFMNPKVAPRQTESRGLYGEPWPYTEGLTVAEANNELTLLTVGIFGHVLPNQHGAPLRIVAPWKYGFKCIKSIVKLELTTEQPATFWNTLVPSEYGFESNVNPALPHPRWSQAFERDIGTRNRKPTLPYNGYGEYVAGLYKA